MISVCKINHPPLWSNTLPENLSMENFISKDHINTKSQDFQNYYRLNGAIYVSVIDYLMENKSFIGKQTKAYIMPLERSIDIDTKLDLIIAEGILRSNVFNS